MRNVVLQLLILNLLIVSINQAQSIGWVRVGGFYPDTSLSEAFDDKYLIDDINGDNYPEIAISGHRGSVKFVRFYWGGLGPIDTLPDFEITFPHYGTGLEVFSTPYAVPMLGDVNGDGWGDIGIRMPDYDDEYGTVDCGALFLYWGGPVLDTICDWFYFDLSYWYCNLGSNLVGVGDWNGDGYDDFAASAPSGWEAYGNVCFFLGGNPPSSTPAKIWEGDTVLYELGHSLTAGQFIGDSLLDLLCISRNHGDTTFDYKVEYLIGTESYASSVFTDICRISVPMYFDPGVTIFLHLLGDINNDGYDDILLEIESMGFLPDVENGCHILLGGEDSICHVVLDSAFWFGKSLYGIEDINEDGIDDFYTYDGGSVAHYGGIEVFSGNSLLEFESLYTNDSVQSRHSNVKDLNRDGYPEILCHVGGWNLYTLNRDYIVNVPDISQRPITFEISAKPNPFNSAVAICVGEGLKPSRIEIFDVNGRMVYETPVGASRWVARSMGQPPVDPYEYIWQPEPALGSGVYLVRATAGTNVVSKRIVYLK